MLDLGKHAVFIWSSYSLVFATVAVLIVWLIWDGNRQAKLLAELEKRGVKRRSTGE